MNVWNLVKAAAGFAASTNPIVATALTVYNAVVSDDKQLPITTTGQQIIDARALLPADQQAQMDRQLTHDLGMEQETSKQIEAAYAHDNTGKSTRPRIAMVSCYVCAITAISFMVLLFLDKPHPDWTVVAAVLSPFILWVNTYLNARTIEKRTRYAVAAGQPANFSGLAAIAAQLFAKK